MNRLILFLVHFTMIAWLGPDAFAENCSRKGILDRKSVPVRFIQNPGTKSQETYFLVGIKAEESIRLDQAMVCISGEVLAAKPGKPPLLKVKKIWAFKPVKKSH